MFTLDKLKEMSKEELINIVYNWQISRISDGTSEDDEDKRIPYMGLFWRHMDFFDAKMNTLGKDDDGYVGIMQNNKWEYPERKMTVEELSKFIRMFDAVVTANNKGGCLADIEKETDTRVAELRSWILSLKVE